MRRNGEPSLFWDPHQRLWNRRLVSRLHRMLPGRKAPAVAERAVIWLDTLLLEIESRRGRHNVNRSGYDPSRTINWFDLGTHEDARELRFVERALLSALPNPRHFYAFEANPATFRAVQSKLEGLPNLRCFNVALVKDPPKAGKVRLFTTGRGLGDSVYRKGRGEPVDVPARRLSEVIRDERIDLEGSINLLRMNIEGSEFDVIEDLVERDLVRHFQGFFGMWDDVAKIDPVRDERFRALLRETGIRPFPFNGRDLRFALRRGTLIRSVRRSIMG